MFAPKKSKDKWGHEKFKPSDFSSWEIIHLARLDYICLDALVDVAHKKIIYEVGSHKRFRSLRKAIKYYYKLIEEYEEEEADNDG